MFRKGFGLIGIEIILGVIVLVIGGSFYFKIFRDQKSTIQTDMGVKGESQKVQQKENDEIPSLPLSTQAPKPVPIPTPPPAPAFSASFICTEVLGFSQTGMWYLNSNTPAGTSGGTFEPIVGNSTWQIRAAGGAGLSWADPNFSGWTSAAMSPCLTHSTNPDRVLLTISTPGGNKTVSWWVTNIRNTIQTIRSKYSNVRQIILQPVVGGPGDFICYYNDNSRDPVQASVKNPTIDQAIREVVGGDVVAGMSPEVRTCADYQDNAGHLTQSARAAIGTSIGKFYVNFSPH